MQLCAGFTFMAVCRVRALDSMKGPPTQRADRSCLHVNGYIRWYVHIWSSFTAGFILHLLQL